MTATIRLGTRGSALAMAQSGQVAERIHKFSGVPVELVPVTTEGDTSRASLSSLGGTGVFASALRDALHAGECDLVVHSLKDLPTAEAPGLRIAAVPKRADARDALIARDDLSLENLPEGASVGTGSPRRVAQLHSIRPDLVVRDIRGNIDTRMGMVADGSLDAVVLAAAGLGRLDRLAAVSQYFELSDMPNAPGQGALAVETRERVEEPLAGALQRLEHSTTRLTVTAEREVLARLEAGCAAPVGATAIVDGELLLLTATVYAVDGSRSIVASHALVLEGAAEERLNAAIELGRRAADELLSEGAEDLAPLH